MNPNIAHIVYASDDRFAEILGVSLVSLYETSANMDGIVVYVLDSGITEENRNKLKSLPGKYGRDQIKWIPAQDISKVLSIEVAVDRGSLSQYARLFVSSDLPADLDRVLYLDCDIVINKSIRELWNLDLQGKTIGALKDAFSSYYRENIGLESNDIMFNSGVMLIDLKRWKEQRVEQKLLTFIGARNGKIQQGDQGALNAVLSRDTFCFEPRFNSVTIFYDFNYQEMLIYRKPPKGYYTEDEIRKATDAPSIIHFTTSFLSKRPWVVGCQHRYVDVWMKYKKLSPWKDAELWKDSRPQWKQTMIDVINRMPRRMMISLAGLAQAYGRPLKNRFK